VLGNFFGFQGVIDVTEIIFKNPEKVPPVWILMELPTKIEGYRLFIKRLK